MLDTGTALLASGWNPNSFLHFQWKLRHDQQQAEVSDMRQYYRRVLGSSLGWLYTYCKNTHKMWKTKCVARHSASLFSRFTTCFSYFVPGSAFAQKSQRISKTKHEIWIKCEKCIASVPYSVVYMVKTRAKYLWNAKYDKCIADLVTPFWKTNLLSGCIKASCDWRKCSSKKVLGRWCLLISLIAKDMLQGHDLPALLLARHPGK